MALASLCSIAASADQLNTAQNGSDLLVSVNGGSNGAASQLYNLLAKGGLTLQPGVDGSQLQGKALDASVLYLHGARYYVSFNVDKTASSYSVKHLPQGDVLTLSGEVADELMTSIQKGGAHTQGGIDTVTVSYPNLTSPTVVCFGLFAGRARVNCQVLVK